MPGFGRWTSRRGLPPEGQRSAARGGRGHEGQLSSSSESMGANPERPGILTGTGRESRPAGARAFQPVFICGTGFPARVHPWHRLSSPCSSVAQAFQPVFIRGTGFPARVHLWHRLSSPCSSVARAFQPVFVRGTGFPARVRPWHGLSSPCSSVARAFQPVFVRGTGFPPCASSVPPPSTPMASRLTL